MIKTEFVNVFGRNNKAVGGDTNRRGKFVDLKMVSEKISLNWLSISLTINLPTMKNPKIAALLVAVLFTMVTKDLNAQQEGKTLFDDTTRIRTSLAYLSVGLLKACDVENEILPLIYSNAALGVDHYFWVSYERLIEVCGENQIDLADLMNSAIIRQFELDESVDYVNTILKNNFLRKTNFTYHILIPYLDSILGLPLNDLQFLKIDRGDLQVLSNKMPIMAFTLGEKDYPIIGFYNRNEINDTVVTKAIAKSSPVIISCGPIPYEELIDGDNWLVYISCAASTPLCDACLPSAEPEEIWQYAGSSGGLFNYEVEIKLTDAFDPWGTFGCYADMIPDPDVPNQAVSRYARLSKITAIDYFEGGAFGLVRVQHPIIKPGINPQRYDEVTLCEEVNRICDAVGFNQVCEDYFALDFGIYKLERLNLQPFYFVYTYAEGFWYPSYGQDVRIIYGNQAPYGEVVICTEDKEIIVENYLEAGCLMCYSNQFDYPRKYIGSSDLDFLLGYWNDEVFTVAITPSGSWNVFDCNYWEFDADNDPSFNVDCSNIVTGVPGTLGSQILQISSTPSYFPLRDNHPNVYLPTDKIAIHVEADYVGANDIDQWATIELDTTSLDYSRVAMYFRGRINDYTVTFYELP